MASTGIPPQPGGWLLCKEEEVLSQQQDTWLDQPQLPQSDGSCAAGGKCCPTKRDFPAYVWMGDIVRRLMVIPVIAFVKGDAKSSETLISQFGGKNCTFKVPRLCFTGLKHLDDPMHKCSWVQMVDQKALNDKVTKLSVSPPNKTNKNRILCLKERKEYLQALDGMSAHHCQNAFFHIWFGHNPFGIMLVTPSDMMHLYESSILKQVC
jgi:hypothetical protein